MGDVPSEKWTGESLCEERVDAHSRRHRAAAELYQKMVKTFPPVKVSISTPEHFEQNMVQHGPILKWQEVLTKVIYHIETVHEILESDNGC